MSCGSGEQSLTGGAADDRSIIAREVVLVEEVTDLHLDEVEKLSVVNDIALVHENNDSRNADLTGEQNVLAGLLDEDRRYRRRRG